MNAAPRPMMSCCAEACARSQMLTAVAMSGITGPKGMRNARGASGIFFRKTGIERHVGMYCEKRDTTLMEARYVKLPV